MVPLHKWYNERLNVNYKPYSQAWKNKELQTVINYKDYKPWELKEVRLAALGVLFMLYLPAGYIQEFNPLLIFGASLLDTKEEYG